MPQLADALRELIALGAEGEALCGAIERLELKYYPPQGTAKEKNAARQRRFRDKHRNESNDCNANNVGNVTSVTDDKKEIPRPLRKNPSPSDPKGSSVPTVTLAEQIWALQPAKHRRSTKPDVRRALEPVLRHAEPREVLAACRAYYARPDCRDDDGKYAMGAARLLGADRWRDFTPAAEKPPESVTAEIQAKRLKVFVDTGEWLPSWGARPTEQAA